jgi:hypothetical protein
MSAFDRPSWAKVRWVLAPAVVGPVLGAAAAGVYGVLCGLLYYLLGGVPRAGVPSLGWVVLAGAVAGGLVGLLRALDRRHDSEFHMQPPPEGDEPPAGKNGYRGDDAARGERLLGEDVPEGDGLPFGVPRPSKDPYQGKDTVSSSGVRPVRSGFLPPPSSRSGRRRAGE